MAGRRAGLRPAVTNTSQTQPARGSCTRHQQGRMGKCTHGHALFAPAHSSRQALCCNLRRLNVHTQMHLSCPACPAPQCLVALGVALPAAWLRAVEVVVLRTQQDSGEEKAATRCVVRRTRAARVAVGSGVVAAAYLAPKLEPCAHLHRHTS